jgi:hypothetical protein
MISIFHTRWEHWLMDIDVFVQTDWMKIPLPLHFHLRTNLQLVLELGRPPHDKMFHLTENICKHADIFSFFQISVVRTSMMAAPFRV